MSRLGEWAAGPIVLAVIALSLFAWGYGRGAAHQRGIDDAATAKRIADETRALAADRDAAALLATRYEAERNTARDALAARRPARVAALARPAQCASAGSLGDVVVPAAVVRGVFVDSANGPSSAGSAASVLSRRVLTWPHAASR